MIAIIRHLYYFVGAPPALCHLHHHNYMTQMPIFHVKGINTRLVLHCKSCCCNLTSWEIIYHSYRWWIRSCVRPTSNFVRLNIQQIWFVCVFCKPFNECLRLNSDSGENAFIFKEINQCNEIASQIVNKIGDLRKKHKEQTSVENRKEKGEDTEAPRRKVEIQGHGTLKEAPCSSTNIGIKRKAPVGNAPKPLSVSIKSGATKRDPSNATAGQRKRKKIAVAKAKTSEGSLCASKTNSPNTVKGSREKRDNFLAPNLKYGEPALVWQGSPSKENHSRIYYDACVIGRSKVVATLVRPGDIYLLSTGDSSEKPYIAYCRAVYFDKKSREAKMTAQWFSDTEIYQSILERNIKRPKMAVPVYLFPHRLKKILSKVY